MSDQDDGDSRSEPQDAGRSADDRAGGHGRVADRAADRNGGRGGDRGAGRGADRGARGGERGAD
ncbi:hypothetical protein ACFVZH_30605, partial [Streptomyces sp. NPDC059534]|uniref:hypothetical protein n=1 Tax=Streptomyces sp. NPDC059534 TaxID=3346859 RepID=UPI00369EA2F0